MDADTVAIEWRSGWKCHSSRDALLLLLHRTVWPQYTTHSSRQHHRISHPYVSECSIVNAEENKQSLPVTSDQFTRGTSRCQEPGRSLSNASQHSAASMTITDIYHLLCQTVSDTTCFCRIYITFWTQPINRHSVAVLIKITCNQSYAKRISRTPRYRQWCQHAIDTYPWQEQQRQGKTGR